MAPGKLPVAIGITIGLFRAQGKEDTRDVGLTSSFLQSVPYSSCRSSTTGSRQPVPRWLYLIQILGFLFEKNSLSLGAPPMEACYQSSFSLLAKLLPLSGREAAVQMSRLFHGGEKNDTRAAWMGTIFQAWLAVKNELIQKRHI